MGRARAPRRTAGVLIAAMLLAAGCEGAGRPPAGTGATGSTTAGTGTATSGRTTGSSRTGVSTGPTAPRTSTSSTPPAGDVPAGLLGKDLEVMPTSRKEIALTFDGGGDDRAVAPILATLRRTATPGTFFLTGDFVQEFPASARAIAAAHRIGNHTQSHPFLTTLGDARVRAEITSAQAAIRTATGKDPRPWFRFPAGDRDARVIADANVLGYACIRWTVDSLGWKGTTGQQSVATVTERVLAAARPGAIVLMHVGAHPKDGTILDANALDAVIAGLRAKGYTLVSLDVMLS